jgi:iron complex transport system ATP-binding protein
MSLAARGLGIGYRGRPVGRNLDLELHPGEIVCLLGPNGCGKSTLFKTLLGLLPRQGGEITVDARPLASLSRAEIARRLAYVPQAHEGVFAFTAHDHVLMGRTAHLGTFAAPGRADREKADAALALLRIAELAHRELSALSGGQRQLVLFARALAQESRLLVLDEPTASLDFGNQVVVLREVRRLAERGAGVLLATHAPDHALALADRVLLMREGSFVAVGPPERVLTETLLAEVYGVGVRVGPMAGGGRVVCVPELN